LIPPGTDPLIGRWIIDGIPKPSDSSKPIPKIKVFVKLNVGGILTVSSAQHLEEYIVEEPVEEPKADPKAKPEADKADAKAKPEDASKSDEKKRCSK